VNSLKDYDISFVKLKPGEHHFSYEIEDAFFRIKEPSLIEQGNVNVHLILDKKERLMNLSFQFEGIIKTDCDVCLDPFNLPIKGNDTFVVKIVDIPQESDTEILYLGPNDSSFNIYDNIYELICTSIPMTKSCKDNAGKPKECNPDMLKFLLESNSENTNIENQTDPRWDKLKNITD
jgi:uncharacterized metal-binding protein YceD (DUF177 family)